MLTKKVDEKIAYEKAIDVIKSCASENGFKATVVDISNYNRVWGRDGVIIGLACLLDGDKELVECFKKNQNTLAKFQGRNGKIPSNVDPEKKYVSYGMTVGRVDADMWYVIGCSQYFKHTHEKKFLKKHFKKIEKVMQLLESWEFNQKGLIYVPESGDWADEFLNRGYVLYDELLYYLCLKEYAFLLSKMKKSNRFYLKKAAKLKNLIKVNFWLRKKNRKSKLVYHDGIFERALGRVGESKSHWVNNFGPFGYNNRFDGFANILSILLGISDKKQVGKISKYILKSTKKKYYLVPAFWPPYKKAEREWRELATNFSFDFKNVPYESHNGGLWPMLAGFYIAALCSAKKKEEAQKYLEGLNFANYKGDGEHWGFYEFHHGKNLKPLGIKHVGWSAAATVIGHHTLKGKKVFI